MKKLLQSLVAGVGYEVFKRDVRFHSELCAARMAERHGIRCILDVGANVGQYASELREWGYRGQIVSFEPLSQAHAALSRAAAGDPAWTVAPRCAVGAARASSVINIAANSVSSSLLEMNETHEKAAPNSKYSGREEVEIRPLDDLVAELCDPAGPFYLKIDTQGYEKAVLEGAAKTLPRCAAVQLELSLTPLYDGGFQFHEGIDRMRELGFRVFAIYPGFSDRTTGENFQVDAVFVPAPASAP
jgi:FkbM family methyltransferase